MQERYCHTCTVTYTPRRDFRDVHQALGHDTQPVDEPIDLLPVDNCESCGSAAALTITWTDAETFVICSSCLPPRSVLDFTGARVGFVTSPAPARFGGE